MIVVLLFSLAALGIGARFAWRPRPGMLEPLRALSAATTFAVLGGVASNFGTVMSSVATHPEWSKDPELHLIVMVGLAETSTVAILGFTALSLVWMLVAVGHRRAHALGEPI